MSTFVRCPCCNRPIHATADDIGLTVQCPRTGRLVPVRKVEDGPADVRPQVHPARDKAEQRLPDGKSTHGATGPRGGLPPTAVTLPRSGKEAPLPGRHPTHKSVPPPLLPPRPPEATSRLPVDAPVPSDSPPPLRGGDNAAVAIIISLGAIAILAITGLVWYVSNPGAATQDTGSKVEPHPIPEPSRIPDLTPPPAPKSVPAPTPKPPAQTVALVPPKAESVPAPTPKPPAKSVALAPLKADPAPRPPATEPAPAAGNPDPAKIPPRVENIDTLSDDLNNPNTVVRRTAIVGLASRLRDQDTAVRRQAISRLADIGPDAELVSDDIRAAVEDADPEVRTTAKRICGRLESLAADRKRQETRRLVVECAKRLKAKDPVERVKALMDLEKFGPDAEVVGEQVIETMRDEIGAVQTAAAAALEKINPKVHPHIVAIVRGPKSGRRAAVMALGGLGEDARIALPILLQCNDNAFLWGGGNPKAGRYHEDLFPLIAKVAPKDKRFVTAVLTYVAAPNPQRDRTIRDRRLAGIAQLESLEADTTKKIDALVEALADIDTVVPVICALEGYGTDAKPAIPKLRELKSSRIESIRDAAIKALAKIE